LVEIFVTRAPIERRPLLAVTPYETRLSLVEASLRTNHIGVARVDGQEVHPRRLSLHDPLDLDLSHPHHLPKKVLGADRPVDDGARRRCLQSSSSNLPPAGSPARGYKGLGFVVDPIAVRYSTPIRS
jgi:hypothetical protein